MESPSSTDLAQLFGSVYSTLAAPFASTHTLNELSCTNKQDTTETNDVTTETSCCSMVLKHPPQTQPIHRNNCNWRLIFDKQVRTRQIMTWLQAAKHQYNVTLLTAIFYSSAN